MVKQWIIACAALMALNSSAQSVDEWKARIQTTFDGVTAFEASVTMTFRSEGSGDTTSSRHSLEISKTEDASRIRTRDRITFIQNGYTINVVHEDEEIMVTEGGSVDDIMSKWLKGVSTHHMSDVGQMSNAAGQIIKYFKLTPPRDSFVDYRYIVVAINTATGLPVSIETWYLSGLHEHIQIRGLTLNPAGLSSESIAFNRSDYPDRYEFIAPSTYETN